MARGDFSLSPGARWREKESGRIIVILCEEVHGTGPSWRYEDDPSSWHYCDVCDFVLWGRFEHLPRLQLVPSEGA